MSQNPYESPDASNEGSVEKNSASTAISTYNVVTDTVTGVNVRWSDNKFQAVFVLASVVLSSLLGAILSLLNSSSNLPWFGGAIIGSFAGLIIGILASGIFLMFYRAARHIKGKHD